MSYIQQLVSILPDRLLADVDPLVRDALLTDRESVPVSTSLHAPPDGFAVAGSFRDRSLYARVQVVLFAPAGAGRSRWMADIDVDSDTGAARSVTVLRNFLTAKAPTRIRSVTF